MEKYFPAICGIASLLIPGLGQAFLKKWLLALVFFVSAGIVWHIAHAYAGWIVHLIAAWFAYVDAKNLKE